MRKKPCRRCLATEVLAADMEIRSRLQDRFLGEMHRRALTVKSIRDAADSIEKLLAGSTDTTLDDCVKAGFLFGLRLNIRAQPKGKP